MRSDPGINGDAQRIEQIIWALFLKVYDAKEEDWEMDEDEYHSVIPEKYRWQNWAHDDGKGTVRTGEELLDFVTELFTVLKNLPITPDMPKNKKIVRTMFEETNQYMKDGVLLRQVINVIDGIDLESYENMHALGDIYETILRELQSAGRAGEFYTPRAVTDFMAERIEPHLGEVMADFACGTGGFLVSWKSRLRRPRTANFGMIRSMASKRSSSLICWLLPISCSTTSTIPILTMATACSTTSSTIWKRINSIKFS